MIVETITYESPLDALVALIRALITYEQRYQMTSAAFCALYQQGTAGDSADVVEWAGDYQQYLGLLQDIKGRLNAVG